MPCTTSVIEEKDCPCPKKAECERFAKCCACVMNHRNMGNLPFCFRPPVTEEKK